MNNKYYLDQDGVRILVDHFHNDLSAKANKAELNQYATKQELNNVSVDLTGYATESYVLRQLANMPKEAYDDSEIRDQIEALENKTSGLYHFKGSLNTQAELSDIQNPQVGDTYNIEDSGMNYAWTGTIWDSFGSLIDLTPYAKNEDIVAITRSELNAILYSGPTAIVKDREGIESMLANNEPEIEITLTQTMNLDDPIAIPSGKKVTIDLGGREISNSSAPAFTVNGGELILKNGNITTDTSRVNTIEVNNSGQVTVEGARIYSAKNQAINVNNGNVIVESGNISGLESGIAFFGNSSITVNGGIISGIDNGAIMGNGTAGVGGGTVIINGGTLEGHIQSAGYIACAVYMPNEGSFIMNDGVINSDGCGICMRGGTVDLRGGSVYANGQTGVKGKVGDSRVVVGPYAIVYDANSKYPAVNTLELKVADGVTLRGTDGDIDVLLADGYAANITDLRNS